MVETTTANLIACSACGGDPRRSVNCAQCGGAGVGVPSDEGFLVWTETVDDFTIALRKIRHRFHAVFHLALLALGLATLIVFGWRVAQLENISDVLTGNFWFTGQWQVTFFWIGLLIDCFVIFRVSEYTHESKTLPGWGTLKGSIQRHPNQERYRFDIQPYFSSSALDVIEDAYRVAKSLNRIEITPQTLFAATLASGDGGLFLSRLGIGFETVKEPLARVLTGDASGAPPIVFSKEAKQALASAYLDARAANQKEVTPMEIFIRSFSESARIQDVFDRLGFPPSHVRNVAEWIRIQDRMHDDHERFIALARLKPSSGMNRAMTARQTPLLDRFSEDLTLAARSGYLAPLVGREQEMEELLRGIESGSRSVALVGEPGVGKSALIEELARRMVEEEVPKELFDKRLVSVDIAKVIAGGDPALAGDRLTSILLEVEISGNIILVLHGAESLTGTSAGPLDLSEILASELDKRLFLAIVTTTPGAWTQYLERRSLGAKLVKVVVREPEPEDTLSVLMARSGLIEYQNHIFLSYAALDAAVQLSYKYLHDTSAPEKSLNILREAAVLARKSRGEKAIVRAEDVAKIIHDKTAIPVETISQKESSKLLSLEEKLHARIIGQDRAVTAVAQAMRRARAELREGKRPIANFLFLGPTGVGKTELAKALAAEYFGSEDAMIRLDMSEYQDASSVARIIGAPGDPRGGLLTEAVRAKPFTIVLLDEMEKADRNILNLFLQVMDDGRLTDGIGRTVDFTNTLLIMTSNVQESELPGKFRPEFLNRFDGIITFKPLTMDDVTQITHLLLHGVSKRMEDKGITLDVTDEAVEELAHAGFDPNYGARPLRRVIQERVDNGLADLLLRGQLSRKDTVTIEKGGEMRVTKAPAI